MGSQRINLLKNDCGRESHWSEHFNPSEISDNSKTFLNNTCAE